MAALNGTIVASKIVPTDSLDTFATHDEKYGQGGYRSVPTIADRDVISTERRREGMLVNVLADNEIYKLVGGIENTNWVSLDEITGAASYQSYTAGQTIHSVRVVSIGVDGSLVLAQPEDSLSVIGISLNNASTGELVKVITKDVVSDPSLSLTPGQPVFFIADGIITQTPPNTIASCIVGTATSTTSFIYQKMLPIFF